MPSMHKLACLNWCKFSGCEESPQQWEDMLSAVQGMAHACLPRWATRARVLGWGDNSKVERNRLLSLCGQNSSAWVLPSRRSVFHLLWLDTW